jgi:predicted enzyme related to lactoylglutathione lyase
MDLQRRTIRVADGRSDASRSRRLALRPAQRLALLIAVTAAAGVAAAGTMDLPPLVQPASAEHHVGKVVWADLVTPDLDAARRFYGGVFGWTFADAANARGDYALAYVGGRPVAGVLQRATPAGEHGHPVWLSFLAVRDVDATSRTALEHGARVVFASRTYPGRGRQAVLRDPAGAVFGILASSSGDPADVLAEPGEWIWCALQVRDPSADAGFYRAVIVYDVDDVPGEDSLKHAILSSDGFARASINSFPDQAPGRRAHWLGFVRVRDVAGVASRAVALGGQVLLEPRPDRHGGNLAIIADPVGAPIGLMEWTDSAPDEGRPQEPR